MRHPTLKLRAAVIVLLSGEVAACPVMTFTARPGTIPAGGSATLSVTITDGAVAVPAATVTFTGGGNCGRIAPPTAVTAATGIATTSFAGAYVTAPCTTIITASGRGGPKTATVTVTPLPAATPPTDSWTPGGTSGFTVTVTGAAPSWSYTFTTFGAPNIRSVALIPAASLSDCAVSGENLIPVSATPTMTASAPGGAGTVAFGTAVSSFVMRVTCQESPNGLVDLVVTNDTNAAVTMGPFPGPG